MSARMVYDLVEPAVLNDYIRTYDNEVIRNDIGQLQAFLPNFQNNSLEWRANRSTYQDVDVAEYRSWDTQPKMGARQGFTRIRGELAPVSRQIALTEEDVLRLEELRSGDNSAIINQIYNDAEAMARSVAARIELARGQVLTTGKFTLNENGLIAEADFGMPGTHKPTAAAAWNVAATDILADLLSWTQLYVDDNGFEPGTILMPRQVLSYCFLNTKMLQAASFAGTAPSRLNAETVAAIFAANGLAPVTLYDTKVRVNGTATPILPVDRVLFLPPPEHPLGKTHYGVTAEALKLAGKGLIKSQDAAGLTTVVLENDNPVQTFTLSTAVAVPVLGDPNAVICADVIP